MFHPLSGRRLPGERNDSSSGCAYVNQARASLFYSETPTRRQRLYISFPSDSSLQPHGERPALPTVRHRFAFPYGNRLESKADYRVNSILNHFLDMSDIFQNIINS
jgi:hypothetical protein